MYIERDIKVDGTRIEKDGSITEQPNYAGSVTSCRTGETSIKVFTFEVKRDVSSFKK